MTTLLHNLKVALRNLMKYKLQTVISILSIAIGIVTLAFAHSILTNVRIPFIFQQPYSQRTYEVRLKPIGGKTGSLDGSLTDPEGKGNGIYDYISINNDIIRAIKRDGGLRCAEKIAVPNGMMNGLSTEFHLTDSTVRKGIISGYASDPAYADYAGFRSAISGEKIKLLKKGEAIVSEELAKKIFQDKNPIGAVQTLTGNLQPIPVTIVDVYRPLSLCDKMHTPDRNDCLYFCITDSIEDMDIENHLYAIGVKVVLKEGFTKKQLQMEVNERVKPLGLETDILNVYDKGEIASIYKIRSLIYLFGSLILLAAIIGFMRIQFQLFRLRRREISLRIVNGASRLKLFWQFVTEMAITLFLSVMAAVGLGYLLQDFLDTDLGKVINQFDITIKDLWIYCLATGGGLFIICTLILWTSLSRMLKSGQGLAANMRRSRNHLFRNIMLGLQILISIVFVSATFSLWKGADVILKLSNISENDDFYKRCLVLRLRDAQQPQRLLDEIKKLPDLEKMVMFSYSYNPLQEVQDNPEAVEKLERRIYFKTYFVTDPEMPSIFGMDVEWANRAIDRNECILVSESLYSKLGELGLLDKKSLTPDNLNNINGPLPIGGMIRNIPYNQPEDALVAILPAWGDLNVDYMLIPKAGKEKSLTRSVNEAVSRLEPEVINDMVDNFREFNSPQIPLIEAISTGGSILGVVSLIICAMSIFSAIALDTRARRKEVAVRKVNGAKGHDIYLLFGKMYVILITVVSVIAVPLCVGFNQVIEHVVDGDNLEEEISISPAGPIIVAILTVTTMITLIVGWQIHKVMQTDPAKVIAKE